MSITSKLDLFSNYIENPQSIVVNRENLIALRINKFITVNINIHLIYDDKIKIAKEVDGVEESYPRVQFKEIFGLGISFKF